MKLTKVSKLLGIMIIVFLLNSGKIAADLKSNWNKIGEYDPSEPGSFPALESTLMVEDVANNEIILIGENHFNTQVREIWTFSQLTNTWSLVNLDNLSNNKVYRSLIYNPFSESVILITFDESSGLIELFVLEGDQWVFQYELDFNGDHYWMNTQENIMLSYKGTSDKFNFTSETALYSFDDQQWSNVTSKDSPFGFWKFASAYNPIRDELLIFGGLSPHIYFFEAINDTWIFSFNTSTWSKVETTLKPGSRSFASMVFNPIVNSYFLYGGHNLDSIVFDDIWKFEPELRRWNNFSISEAGPRSFHSMVYDKTNKNTILYGGYLGRFNYLDSWTFRVNSNSELVFDWGVDLSLTSQFLFAIIFVMILSFTYVILKKNASN